MLKLVFGLLSLALFSCASSRTEVAEINNVAQTVAGGAAALVANSPGVKPAAGFNPTTKVQSKISGHIILTDNCLMLKKNFEVEIWPSRGSKYLYTTPVKEDSYTFDVGLPYEGAYKIQLVDARSGKMIESKNFAASKTNDRFNFDFRGCSE